MRLRHLLAAALVTMAAAPSSALADDPAVGAIAGDLQQALSAEGVAGPTTSSDLAVPSDGNGDVGIGPGTMSDGQIVMAEPALTLGLPANGSGTTVGTTTVFDGDHAANQIAVQATDMGARALIRIEDASAPTAYPFALGGAAETLRAQDDGSVLVLDATGATMATLAAPWARDSDGRLVDTRYELYGTDILQVVDHRQAAVAYPVVADPSVDLDPGWVTLKATFSRDITNRVASLVVGAVGAAAAMSEVCSLIPHFALKLACKALIAGRAYNFIMSARDARSQRKCLYYQAPYVQLKSGWFGVNGNKDCKDR